MIRILLLVASLAMLSACGGSKFKSYNGPEVTGIIVKKGERKMYLLNGNEILKTYDFELGFTPEGHKQFEGDGKTPEGGYFIDRKNPRSSYHLSIGISYPNPADRAYAAQRGKRPGGEIFIHGTPKIVAGDDDWTAGCIAVTNKEMEDIYAMVETGTPIWIYP